MTDAQRDRDDGEWRCKDLRLWIAMNVGRRQNYESPLSKKVLNSVHRYLTGEFHYAKELHGTAASPDVDDLRHDLCILLAGREYETFEDICEGADTSGLVPASTNAADSPTRPFRKNELHVLRAAIQEEEDQRPMSKRGVVEA